MRAKTYNTYSIAKEIANGHAFYDHVLRPKEKWGELNVTKEKEFEKHISKILKDKDTKVFQAANNRDVYYHPKTNTIVSVNLLDKNKGTCYRPSSKEKHFYKNHNNDFKLRKQLRLEKSYIKNGGYNALYKGKIFDKNLAEIKENFKKSNSPNDKQHRATKQIKKLAKCKPQRIKNIEEKQRRTALKREAEKRKAAQEAFAKKEQERKAAALKQESRSKTNNLAELAKREQEIRDRKAAQAKQEELARKQAIGHQAELDRERRLEEERRRYHERTYQNQHDLTKRR